MLIKGITDEDFINYKVPSMYIATATCDFKCDKEYGKPICQNSELAKQPDIDISNDEIVERYLNNPITHAIVFGGLEPAEQLYDIIDIIYKLRYSFLGYNKYEGCPENPHPKSCDDVIIYTGYKKNEFREIFWHCHAMYHGYKPWIWMDFKKQELSKDIEDDVLQSGLIVKYGRYIPGQQPHYDPVLGVYLASDNQYAERIS